MLLPKKTKFRRQHRGRFKGASRANTVIFGDYGNNKVTSEMQTQDTYDSLGWDFIDIWSINASGNEYPLLQNTP